MKAQTRSRLVLLLLVLLFAAPITVAIVLHASGWEPTQTRNHGELLRPALDIRDLVLHRADGSVYAWEPAERRWRIAVYPPTNCTQACVDLIAGLDKVWQLQGRRADRLDVLWFGPVPEGAVPFRRFVPMQSDEAVRSRLPGNAESGNPSAYLIDPSGYVALRYAPGFDVANVREDVARLLKH
jgi:hypothetical protein